MALNKVDIWKKLYAWITYMRPHFQYAAHIYCNDKIDQIKKNLLIRGSTRCGPGTRSHIPKFSMKCLLGMRI